MLSLQGSDSTNDDNNFNLVTIGVPSVVGGVLLFAVVWWVCVVRVRRKRKRAKGREEKGKGRAVGEVVPNQEREVVQGDIQGGRGGGGDSLEYGAGSACAGSGHGGLGGGEGMRGSLGQGSGVGYAGGNQRYGQDYYGRPGPTEREVVPIVMVRNDSGLGGSHGTYGGANGAGVGAAGGYWGDRHWQWPGGYV